MRSFYLLLVILVLTSLSIPAIQAQNDENREAKYKRLEESLAGVQGQERFETLVELARLTVPKGDNKKILRFAEEARELLSVVNDPEKEVHLYKSLTFAYSNLRELDAALDAASQLEKLARDLGDTKKLAYYFMKMGNISRYQAKHHQALEYYAQAIPLYESVDSNVNIAIVLNNSALVHKALGDYVEALKLYILAREAYNKVNKLSGVALTSNNIGDIYMVLGQLKEAEKSFQQALKITTQVRMSPSRQAGALQGLGDIALKQEDPQRALKLFQQALDIYLNLDGYLSRRVKAYNSVGQAWSALGNYDNELDFNNKALTLATDINDYSGQVHSLLQIALIHHKQDNLKTAIELCEQALNIAREKNYVSDIRMLLKTLQLLYADTGQHQKAYESLKEYEKLNMESLNKDSRRIMARMQAEFETSERETTIDLLEKDKVLNQTRLERQQDIQRILLVSFVVLLFLLYLWWIKHSSLVNKLKQNSEKLKEAKDVAEKANTAKSEFLANMSHELRTPMNAVIGYSEFLVDIAKMRGQEDMVPDLEKIRGAGGHLLALINDVLDLSKIEAEKIELSLETISVDALLTDIKTTSAPLFDKNKNRFEHIEVNQLGEGFLDKTKLSQILLNILSNAAKFTHQGTITLSSERITEAETDYFIFRISDTGIGIKPEKLEEIYEPFTQADLSITRKFGGTGLGLSISRKFCEIMDGELSVESKESVGSTFTVRIPYKHEKVFS